jgi:hypothetical protein
MQGVIEGYQNLLAQATEVIQVTPNLLESARRFFRPDPVPYPVVCDPDKRLYAVYGLGDRGVLEATSTAVVSWASWLRPPELSTTCVLVGLPFTTNVPVNAAAALAAPRPIRSVFSLNASSYLTA